jgi:hypothetical protein
MARFNSRDNVLAVTGHSIHTMFSLWFDICSLSTISLMSGDLRTKSAQALDADFYA